jgi:hypothetical protein
MDWSTLAPVLIKPASEHSGRSSAGLRGAPSARR